MIDLAAAANLGRALFLLWAGIAALPCNATTAREHEEQEKLRAVLGLRDVPGAARLLRENVAIEDSLRQLFSASNDEPSYCASVLVLALSAENYDPAVVTNLLPGYLSIQDQKLLWDRISEKVDEDPQPAIGYLNALGMLYLSQREPPPEVLAELAKGQTGAFDPRELQRVKATELFKRVLERQPGEPGALIGMAIAESQGDHRGLPKEARDTWLKALEKTGSLIFTQETWWKISLDLTDAEDARRLLEAVKDTRSALYYPADPDMPLEVCVEAFRKIAAIDFEIALEKFGTRLQRRGEDPLRRALIQVFEAEPGLLESRAVQSFVFELLDEAVDSGDPAWAKPLFERFPPAFWTDEKTGRVDDRGRRRFMEMLGKAGLDAIAYRHLPKPKNAAEWSSLTYDLIRAENAERFQAAVAQAPELQVDLTGFVRKYTNDFLVCKDATIVAIAAGILSGDLDSEKPLDDRHLAILWRGDRETCGRAVSQLAKRGEGRSIAAAVTSYLCRLGMPGEARQYFRRFEAPAMLDSEEGRVRSETVEGILRGALNAGDYSLAVRAATELGRIMEAEWRYADFKGLGAAGRMDSSPDLGLKLLALAGRSESYLDVMRLRRLESERSVAGRQNQTPRAQATLLEGVADTFRAPFELEKFGADAVLVPVEGGAELYWTLPYLGGTPAKIEAAWAEPNYLPSPIALIEEAPTLGSQVFLGPRPELEPDPEKQAKEKKSAGAYRVALSGPEGATEVERTGFCPEAPAGSKLVTLDLAAAAAAEASGVSVKPLPAGFIAPPGSLSLIFDDAPVESLTLPKIPVEALAGAEGVTALTYTWHLSAPRLWLNFLDAEGMEISRAELKHGRGPWHLHRSMTRLPEGVKFVSVTIEFSRFLSREEEFGPASTGGLIVSPVRLFPWVGPTPD